ncbi:MAG: diguanylate cyclase [Sulfuricurvum sp.]
MIQKRSNYFLIVFFLVVVAVVWVIIDFYRQEKIETYQRNNFITLSSIANQKIDTLIDEKRNATLVIALSLSTNYEIKEALLHKTDVKPLITMFSEALKSHTDFKNVWIQIVDPQGISLARSWNNKRNENLAAFRSDVRKMIASPQPMATISVGKFDMTFKAMVPVYDEHKGFSGFVETISHFNSIAKKLEDEGFKTLIVVDKRFTKQLTKPFTKIFVNGNYIANSNADPALLQLLQNKGLPYFTKNPDHYTVDEKDQQLIIRYTLNDIMGKITEGSSWVDAISELAESERIIMIADRKGVKYIFRIEVNHISDNFKVVSLIDITETTEENIRLQNKIFYDPLTHVHNRDFFETQTGPLIQIAELQKKQLALTIFDIDYFKLVNDTYGHNTGDKILSSLAALVKQSLRSEDELIRWGGEEFIILFITDSLHSAIHIIDNLRKKIEAHPFEKVPSLTCSFGITLTRKDEALLDTLQRADEALYQAKNDGRNCVRGL